MVPDKCGCPVAATGGTAFAPLAETCSTHARVPHCTPVAIRCSAEPPRLITHASGADGAPPALNVNCLPLGDHATALGERHREAAHAWIVFVSPVRVVIRSEAGLSLTVGA